MRILKYISIILFTGILSIACSSDDNGTPMAVNEEEVITTLAVTLTPDGGGTAITLQTRDLDGDGPNAPEITVSGNLAAGVTYNGSIVLLNETETPAEDITKEVVAEAKEHQLFYTSGGGLEITTAYIDTDSDGNPLGTKFTLTAGNPSSGTLTFTLRHEPTKPNAGLSNAGGETDLEATFSVTVE
ncbi:type 1 periplasmic binding fold superfamily protein [Maribacter algicola]|uniref:Type 1 periplasmic binding fold superfamily protein n=1 Tax=Meishania litoralis TaxID=3434685 RepID=A0ACC7LGD8_9FLAO